MELSSHLIHLLPDLITKGHGVVTGSLVTKSSNNIALSW